MHHFRRSIGQLRFWWAAMALTLLAACQTLTVSEPRLVIEDVTVLSMVENAAPLRNVSVVIRGGHIVQIAPSSQFRPSDRDRRVDGRGRFLIPGLTYMHAHPENAAMLSVLTGGVAQPAMTAQDNEDVFLPFVAHGVTQILNMSANPDAVMQRAAIERGEILGPHMALAAMVDGPPRLLPFGTEVEGPEAGAAFVRAAHGVGYDFIKVYSQINAATFEAIVIEATRQNMRVIGHIPGRGANAPERFIRPEFALIGHAEEFAFQGANVAQSQASIPAYVAMLRRSGGQLTSTLTLDERILEQARNPDGINTRRELRYLSRPVRAF